MTAETARHRETSGKHVPADTQLASPQGQRHSISHPDTGRQAGDTTPEPASQHLASDRRDWETSGRHDPGASVTKNGRWETPGDKRETQQPAGDTTVSQHLASDRIDWPRSRHRHAGDTTPASQHLASDRGDTSQHPTAETGRHRETSRRHDPGASVTASGIRLQRLGDKRETRPRSQRHEKREMGDTGRQAGDTTPEPASQHLASRHRETSTRHDPGARVTASGI